LRCTRSVALNEAEGLTDDDMAASSQKQAPCVRNVVEAARLVLATG
jgi:hypothetical protein